MGEKNTYYDHVRLQSDIDINLPLLPGHMASVWALVLGLLGDVW